MLQTSLLLMKSPNKTETPIFLSVVCSLFPKAIFLTFILKFCTNICYLLLYRVRENHISMLIIPFICPFFSFSPIRSFVKYFSGTTAPRILKFCTNISYFLLYRVRENHISMLIIPFICPFFFFSNKIFRQRFLRSYESQSSNFEYIYRGLKYIV